MNINHPRDDTWITKMLTQLKVVAQLEKGDKLCTEGALFYIEPSSYLTQCVKRTYHGETRTRNLQRISDVVDKIIDHLRSVIINTKLSKKTNTLEGLICGMDTQTFIKRCLNALSMTINGLRNLSYSYTNDACVMAQLDCVIENINAFLDHCNTLNVCSDESNSSLESGGKIKILPQITQ